MDRCEQFYAGMCTKRLSWFDSLSRDPRNALLAVIASGSVDCPFPKPRLTGSISMNGEVAFSGQRSVGIVRECSNAARARVSASQPRITLWLPFTLRNGNENHALALHATVTSSSTVVYAFEPHGSDPHHAGHAKGTFHKFYHAHTFQAAVRELVLTACPDATLYLPSDYLAPAFGQSCSSVLGHGVGDRWCVLWTLAFMLFTTVNGSPGQFVAMVQGKQKAGTLSGWLQMLLATTPEWMVSPLVPLPLEDSLAEHRMAVTAAAGSPARSIKSSPGRVSTPAKRAAPAAAAGSASSPSRSSIDDDDDDAAGGYTIASPPRIRKRAKVAATSESSEVESSVGVIRTPPKSSSAAAAASSAAASFPEVRLKLGSKLDLVALAAGLPAGVQEPPAIKRSSGVATLSVSLSSSSSASDRNAIAGPLVQSPPRLPKPSLRPGLRLKF